MNKIRNIAIYFYVCFVVFFLIRISDGFTFFSLEGPFIHTPRLDPVMWITHASGIADFLSSSYLGTVYDAVILLLPLYIIFRLYDRKDIRWWSLAFVLLYGFYIILLYTYPILSIRKYLGFLIVPIAFIPKRKWAWKVIYGIRFYALFVFASAGLWKIIRGTAFDPDHMAMILKAQHFGYIVHERGGSWTQDLYRYLISHPEVSFVIWIAGILLQLSFIVGFFTRAYDKILLGLLLLFIVADFFLMKIGFWEFLIFIPFFLLPNKSNVKDRPVPVKAR